MNAGYRRFRIKVAKRATEEPEAGNFGKGFDKSVKEWFGNRLYRPDGLIYLLLMNARRLNSRYLCQIRSRRESGDAGMEVRSPLPAVPFHVDNLSPGRVTDGTRLRQ
jgi:hypothetical protein